MRALEIAMATEKEGERFYRQAAEKTEHPKAREMFISLAEDEQQHRRWLEEQEKQLHFKGEWFPYEALPGKRRRMEKGLPIFSSEEVIRDIEKYRSQIPTLKAGMEMEEKSQVLYTEASDQCPDEKGKAMFSELAAWEKEHWELLKKEYEFLLQEYKGSMGFEPF